MQQNPAPSLRPFAVLFLALSLHGIAAAQLIDDRPITITTPREAADRRRALIQHLWGAEGFPDQRLPTAVAANVTSPVKELTDLARVDELRIDQAPGLQGLAYHFIPRTPNGEAIVVHHGHGCTLDDDPAATDVGYGMQRTIAGLLHEGYGVLGVFMPHMRPGDCTGNHKAMFDMKTTGSPMKYFLEPVAVGLNYLQKRSDADHYPSYRVFHMAGLSGGGWTTTVYAAIDPRIRCSFPIAGSIPLYLRSGGSVGDLEQFEPSFYRLAGYPELYILGAHGPGRRQVQILNQRDDCCFGQAQHNATTAGQPFADAMRGYERRVKAALEKLGQGSFALEIDETAPSHMISHHAIRDIVIPALRQAK